MAYATVSDVQARTRGRTISTTTKPTATDVIGYLEETAAVLDGLLLAQGYELPPTATQALRLLEHYNAIGAWAMTERAAQVSPDEDAAEKAWAEAQKMLADGKISLGADLPDSAELSGPRGAGAATPAFTIDMEL